MSTWPGSSHDDEDDAPRAISTSEVNELVEHLHGRSVNAALAMTAALADEGVPLADILTGLVGPAQAEIGERWYRNDYSVADEHAATSVADTVVALLSSHEDRPAPAGPHVVALCAEGEWHTMALRITAQVLELDGLEVSFLGASVPSGDLARFIVRTSPDVVVLSCSTPLAFDGVLAAVEVVHQAGLPVVAGGRALGTDERRAHALGIDHWAATAAAGVSLVRSAVGGPLRVPTANAGAARALALDRPRLVNDALAGLAKGFPQLADYSPLQLQRTREDIEYIVRFAEASILVDDVRVFDEFISWLGPLLSCRNVAAAALDTSLALLRDNVDGPRAELFDRAHGSTA